MIRPHVQKILKGVLALVFMVLLADVAVSSSPTLSSKTAALVAHGFVSYCKDAGDKALCYETQVPKLLHITSVEHIFPVIRAIQKEDPSYRFCHVLGHQLGIEEVKRDPAHWMGLMHKNPPDSLCSNGYIHGVIVGKFHFEELPKEQIDAIIPQLSFACEGAPGWNPTDLDKAMCYHGMGHVLTFITGANLPLASSYCKEIAIKSGDDFSSVCMSGVFMQIFQPLEPEDYQLIAKLKVKPTKETLASFCSSFPADERKYCFGEGWPLFRDNLESARGMEEFCGSVKDNASVEYCYQTVFAIGARSSIGNPQKEIDICTGLPAARAQACLNTLSNAFIEEDRTRSTDAVAICMQAPAVYKDACLGNLIKLKQFNFTGDEKNAEALCAAMPEEKRASCQAAL